MPETYEDVLRACELLMNAYFDNLRAAFADTLHYDPAYIKVEDLSNPCEEFAHAKND